MVKQRSDEWYAIKVAKFSASRASELLTFGSRKMNPEELLKFKAENPSSRKTTMPIIGKSLESYALEMAVQEIYGEDEAERYVSYDMQQGIIREPFAFDFFAKKKAKLFLETEEVGFVLHPNFPEHVGASADGYVSDNSGLELKCPKRSTFFKIVAHGLDEVDPKYIPQVQFQMACTGVDRTYFVNYYEEKNKQFAHEIIIDRDEKQINFINERLEYAIERKKDFIEQIKNNIQN